MEAQDIKTLSEEASGSLDKVKELLGESGYAKRRFATETVDAFVGLLNEAADGNLRAEFALREAMVSADFPYLMGDVIDRSIMAQWNTTMPAWRSYTKVGTVKDFRQAKMFGIQGMGAVLESVGERSEYPERGPVEETPITRQVAKYGARFGLSWESVINDDLYGLRELPQRLVEAARRTEALAVSKLYVGSAGFNTNLYSDSNDNIVNTHAGASSTNPALSLAALSQAMLVMNRHTDYDGFPIVIDGATLVVPPALYPTAMNIMNATQIEVATGGGAYNASDQLVANNWMANKFEVVVDPYISMTATSNASTTWFLFASVSAPRPALQVDYLAGYEAPQLFVKAPNASQVGGGSVPMSFETDEQEFRVRHVFGATTIAPFATVASNGSGA